MVEKYPGKVKLVFKNYPLGKHKFAFPAATAALSAGEQGQFWKFHDLLFKNQKQLREQKILEIATSLNLDMKKFHQNRKDGRIVSRIREDVQDARRAVVKGTPTIFVNGRLLRNLSPDGIHKAVEKELERCATKERKDTP